MQPMGARRSQLDALLALYRIWSVERLDLTTVVSTMRVPSERVQTSFELCVEEGYLQEADSGLYELTDQGDNQIEAMITRRSSIGVDSTTPTTAPTD